MRVGMNHPAAPLPLDAEDRSTLEMWARSATAPHRVVSQAKALLVAGDGVANSRIATALGISRPTVLDWRARFRTEGLDSVGAVRPGRGRKPDHHLRSKCRPIVPKNVQIGRKNGMTRSVGADWGPQILRKSQKS